MKYQTERVDLETDTFGVTSKDEGLWVLVPKGVNEAFVRRVMEAGKQDSKDATGRHSNVEVLRAVVDWNFDDEDGQKLDLIRDILPPETPLQAITDDELRRRVVHVLEQCPATFFGWLARKLIHRQQPMSGEAEGN